MKIDKSYNQLVRELNITTKALEVKDDLVNTLRDKADRLSAEKAVLEEIVEELEVDHAAITILEASNRSLRAELEDLKALCIYQESRLTNG